LNIRCRNDSSKRLSFWAVAYPPFDSFEPQLIEFGPFLSAKRLLSTDTFRRLFRAETPGDGEGLAVKDLTYLFTDLKGSTAMYDEAGDGTAYNLVRLHFEALGRAVADNNGVIVKTVGDAVMATFVEPANAVSAAQAMLENIEEFNSSMSTVLELKIGIHRGHSIAVSLNDRLDYFGQNVNIAARTQQQADGGQILISGEVLSDEGVSELLAETTPVQVTGLMKGIAEEIPVYRLAGLRDGTRTTPV
jgi:class 3 adenylate cyclase